MSLLFLWGSSEKHQEFEEKKLNFIAVLNFTHNLVYQDIKYVIYQEIEM